MRYVLTGGPGCGKTSILTALEMMGEYVIPEAARDYYLLQRARGVQAPAERRDFVAEALRLHMFREGNFVLGGVVRAFLDRGTYDHFVYAKLLGQAIPEELARRAREVSYTAAFIVEPTASGWSTPVGFLSSAQSEQIHRELREMYASLRVPVIGVPAAALDDRVGFVLSHANRMA